MIETAPVSAEAHQEARGEHNETTNVSDNWLARTKKASGSFLKSSLGSLFTLFGGKILRSKDAVALTINTAIDKSQLLAQVPALIPDLHKVVNHAAFNPVLGLSTMVAGGLIRSGSAHPSWKIPYYVGEGMLVIGSFFNPVMAAWGMGITVGSAVLSRLFPGRK